MTSREKFQQKVEVMLEEWQHNIRLHNIDAMRAEGYRQEEIDEFLRQCDVRNEQHRKEDIAEIMRQVEEALQRANSEPNAPSYQLH